MRSLLNDTENAFEKNVERILHHDNEKLIRHDDIGAEVTLYFTITGGWMVELVVASVRYVRPLPHHDDLVRRLRNIEHYRLSYRQSC